MKYNKKFLLLVGGILITIISCNKDNLFTTDRSSMKKNGLVCAMSMDYEVEMVTILRPEDGNDLENLSDFDKIEAEPKVFRDKVSFCLTESGEFDISVITKEPLNPYNVPHETLPDDSPEVYEMKIENETTRFYDEQGNLLNETATDAETVASYQELMSIMQQMETMDAATINNMIETARNNGSLVLELDNGIVGIQSSDGQQTVEILMDTNRLLVLGISIYDENNVLQKRIMLDIQGDHTAPVILSMLLQDFETSPTSNIRVIRETQMDFDNFQYFNSIL